MSQQGNALGVDVIFPTSGTVAVEQLPYALSSVANHIATDGNLSNIFTITMTENTTLDNPTNLQTGITYTWEITQGASPYTMDFGTNFTWSEGNILNLSGIASSVSIIQGLWDGTKLRMTVLGQNFSAIPSNAFVMTVNTANTGTSTAYQYTLPTTGSGTYNFVVHWGDGTQNRITTYNDPAITHTYANSGIYKIYITGTLTGFAQVPGDKLKVLNISQWGTFNPGNIGGAFIGYANLTITATDTLDLTGVTAMQAFFSGCSSLTTVPNITTWNMSSVTLINGMFSGCTLFNQSLTGWVLTSVFSIVECFKNATSFNQPISWSIANSNSFNSLFQGATSFNSAVSITTTTNVTDTRFMFDGATSFNQSVNNINVTFASQMDYMFRNATSFNQGVSVGDGGNWATVGATKLTGIFEGATTFNRKVSWTTTSLTRTDDMFKNATAFNSEVTLSLGSCTNASGMFQGATAYNRTDMNTLSTGNIANMSNMFRGATAFNQAVSFTATGCTSASSMFRDATAFNSAITSVFTNCLDFSDMFRGATAFNQSVSSLNSGNGNDFSDMFRGATSYNQSMATFDTTVATTFDRMFQGATAFNQDIGGWNIPSLTSAVDMFLNVTLSNANYNKLLFGWDSQAPNPVVFSGGNSHYDSTSGGVDGVTARASLIGTFGWSISDGGTP
jgi:surface protein